MSEKKKELLFSVTAKDFDFQFFRRHLPPTEVTGLPAGRLCQIANAAREAVSAYGSEPEQLAKRMDTLFATLASLTGEEWEAVTRTAKGNCD